MAFNAINLSRVKLVKNPNYKRNGLKSYVSLLQKYKIRPTLAGPCVAKDKLHDMGAPALMQKFSVKIGGPTRLQGHDLAKADASGNTGEVPADDVQMDVQYLAEVGIGNPAQKLRLNFDTGSSDLWVWSTKLDSNTQAQGKTTGHTIFDASQSTTWKDSPGQTWQLQYGDGSTAGGDVGTDTLTIGGLSIENQAIERAKQLSESFEQSSGDGLLGLAFGNINQVKPQPVKTPVENMISQQDIPKDVELFTAYLGSWRDKNDPDKGESFYTFGYIDQDALQAADGDIFYVDIDNSQGFWQFESPSAQINGKNVSMPSNSAIADTGTTLVLVDDKLCEAIYSAIPGAKQDKKLQGWIFPSTTKADELPVVQLAVGLKLFTVEKEYLSFADAGNGMIYGGIQSRGSMPMDIFGDTFLKSVYAVFDQGNKRFGCVQRVDPDQNLEAPPTQSGSES